MKGKLDPSSVTTLMKAIDIKRSVNDTYLCFGLDIEFKQL